MKLSANENIIYILIISLLSSWIEVDISVPSFPYMEDFFDTSGFLIQSTLGINYLGMFLSCCVWGALSESFGRRRIIIIGNSIMTLGAIGCCFVNDIWMLLFCRLMQGFGASASGVLVFAIIADVYSGKKVADLIAKTNSALTICITIAPIIGGALTEAISWRSSYYFVAILSVISVVLIVLGLPETKISRSKQKALPIYYKLIKDPKFLQIALLLSLCDAVYMVFVSSAPFLYTKLFSLSVFSYSLHQAVILLSFALMSFYVGAILTAIDEKKSLMISLLLMISVVFFSIFFIYYYQNVMFLSFILIVFSVSCAIMYPIMLTKIMNLFPEFKGFVTAAIMAIKSIICVLAISLTGFFYGIELMPVLVSINILVIFIVALSALHI